MRKSYILCIMILLSVCFFDTMGQTGDFFVKIEGLGINLPVGYQDYVYSESDGRYLDGFYLAYLSNHDETEISVIQRESEIVIFADGRSISLTPTIGNTEFTFSDVGGSPLASIIITVTVYDVPTINLVEYSGIFKINSTVASNPPPNAILNLNYRYLEGVWYSKNTTNSPILFESYDELFGELDPCGLVFEFFFSVRINGTSGEIFGNTYSENFVEQVGNVSINNVIRQACPPYLTISVSTDPEIAGNPSRYVFSLIKDGFVYGFDDYSVEGNNIDLYVTNPYTNENISGSEYILHLEDNYGILCGRDMTINPGAPVDQLNIMSALSVVMASVDGTDYHILVNDESTGRVNITIENDDIPERFEIKRSDWSSYQTISASLVGSEYVITGLSAGSYELRCVDNDGCISNIASFIIREPDPFNISDKSTIQAPCHPENVSVGTDNTGTLSFRINGGIPDYNVTINGELYLADAFGLVTLNNLPPGNYSIKVHNGYEGSAFNMAVTTPIVAMTLTESHEDIDCKGVSDGSITLTVNNNTNEIDSYYFNFPGAIEEVITPTMINYSSLPQGNYSASVKDSEGCFAIIENIFINEPAMELSISATGSAIQRYGENSGTITLRITGGTPEYYYDLYRQDEHFSSGNAPENTVIPDLPAGTYRLVITDANGCSVVESDIEVIQPLEPLAITINEIVSVNCYGESSGSASVSASGGWGGYLFQFNSGLINTTGLFSSLQASEDLDSIMVTDSLGATCSIEIIVPEPEELKINSVRVNDLRCYNDHSGSLKLEITGGVPGYRVSADMNNWVEGDSLWNLPAMENRIIYVEDANGCGNSVMVTINEPEPLRFQTPPQVVNANCGQADGGIATSLVGGVEPYQYEWKDLDPGTTLVKSGQIIFGLTSGTYNVTATDTNGCETDMSVFIDDLNGPTISLSYLSDVRCNGEHDGSISVLISGSGNEYDYIWEKTGLIETPEIESGSTIAGSRITGLGMGEYKITVTDENSCMAHAQYLINEPAPLRITGETIDPVCHDSSDGFIAVNVTGGNGGYKFLWSDGSTSNNLEFTKKGEYGLLVTDSLGCAKDTIFMLTAPPPPVVRLDRIENTLCMGNSMVIDGGDHVSYIWRKEDGELGRERYLTVWESGNYILEGFDERGCSNMDTVIINVSDTPLASLFLIKDTAMLGEEIEAIDVTWPVPDSIEWYFNNPVYSVENNDWSTQFTSEKECTVSVTLRTWYNGCYSDSTKNIIFVDSPVIWSVMSMADPLIIAMEAYPNPTEGDFRVAIELSRVEETTLFLFSNMGNIISSRNMRIGGKFEIPFGFAGLNRGVYILELRADNERKQTRIVIE